MSTKHKRIAVLADSCCDVPADLVQQYGLYILPLKIIYHDHEYLDGVDITPQEVYERMGQEIPKTSLPDGEQILHKLDQIKADGYEQLIVITLSSGLSGTNNLIHLIADTYEGMEIFILDTKNIAIGAGFHAIQAARYIEQGLSFSTIQEKLQRDIKNVKIFFVVETLEYLQKGGRIGLVASLLGNALNLKPVISCNEEGVYYTVTKVRGRKQSVSRTMELAKAYAQGHPRIHLAVCHGGAPELAAAVEATMKEALRGYEVFISSQISPALGVHTGPGLIGIGIERLED
ncbi:MAG: DegV family protein [Erysipelotrichaceae bacterium]|nr:DegV family protein [Erysipelotrichaceae bacterium]